MEDGMMKIPILMFGLLTPELNDSILSTKEENPFPGTDGQYSYFGPNAKWLLGVIFNSIGLSITDEVAIISTSNEKYISTCVSVTAFNYAKISRVITNRTKVVIVIHEFGYILPNIVEKVTKWKEKGLVVIEDCAHIIGYSIKGQKIGSFGDFAVFSLPKIIPAQFGGLLRTSRRINLPKLDEEDKRKCEIGICAAEKYLSKFKYFNRERINNAKLFQEQIPSNHLFEPTALSIPYFIGLINDKTAEVKKKISWVEWGATLRNDLLYIPTNPLVNKSEYLRLLKELKYEGCTVR